MAVRQVQHLVAAMMPAVSVLWLLATEACNGVLRACHHLPAAAALARQLSDDAHAAISSIIQLARCGRRASDAAMH